jgi:hypothetical protein
MAEPDVSAVVTLCNKAYDLLEAGHFARSLEYDQRALTAAVALGAEERTASSSQHCGCIKRVRWSSPPSGTVRSVR